MPSCPVLPTAGGEERLAVRGKSAFVASVERSDVTPTVGSKTLDRKTLHPGKGTSRFLGCGAQLSEKMKKIL
jgi:hypothetical protein